LVLLVKTIINIEGLGRQLYPELDLWATAKPFLEKWWKEHYSVRRLVGEFRKHLPEYIDEIAELIPKIKQAIELQARPPEPPPPAKSGSNWRGVGAAMLGIGGGYGLAQAGLITGATTMLPWALVAVGAYLLVRKG